MPETAPAGFYYGTRLNQQAREFRALLKLAVEFAPHSFRRGRVHDDAADGAFECNSLAEVCGYGPRNDGVGHSQRSDTQEANEVVYFQYARVAKPADAKDLKSFSPQGECGFDSRPGHQ